ncbi:hypothetical protein F4604DRAFT_1959255 [Suillus subluteus]|nr:hypothetical protein F4604DRAFT_1959255 [Suillus subluteus]
MASAIKDDSAVEKPEDLPALLSKKFNITDVKQDALKWNKEWEAAIASSTAADVLKEICHFLDDSFFTPSDIEFLHQDLRSVQITAGRASSTFSPVSWRLPESSTKPAFLPNSWWGTGVEPAKSHGGDRLRMFHLENRYPKAQSLLFEVATIDRNKFIGHFVMFSAMSIVLDITNRSEGMKGVLHLMENTEGYVARSLAGTPEDIGQGVRFMVCSVCKTKLKFEVHYCSQACQKQDWSLHKQACGKKPVSKGLRGTKGDSLWAFGDSNPAVELIRNLGKKEGRGLTSLRDIGVNPCKGKRSAAAERQAAMLEADRNVDYFLFTASGEAVRFVIDDPGAKMVFRINRGVVMTKTGDTGLDAMGEYMLKVMSGYPGLSRDIILKQLCEEHGADTAKKIVWLERKTRERGKTTFIEDWLKDSANVFGDWSWLGSL